MKGQIATIEALLALSLIVGIISFVASAENSNYSYSYRQTKELLESEAVYDFISQVRANYSIEACINASGQCIYQYLLKYKALYGLNYVSFEPGNLHIGNESKAELTKCFPYSSQIFCITVG